MTVDADRGVNVLRGAGVQLVRLTNPEQVEQGDQLRRTSFFNGLALVTTQSSNPNPNDLVSSGTNKSNPKPNPLTTPYEASTPQPRSYPPDKEPTVEPRWRV